MRYYAGRKWRGSADRLAGISQSHLMFDFAAAGWWLCQKTPRELVVDGGKGSPAEQYMGLKSRSRSLFHKVNAALAKSAQLTHRLHYLPPVKLYLSNVAATAPTCRWHDDALNGERCRQLVDGGGERLLLEVNRRQLRSCEGPM